MRKVKVKVSRGKRISNEQRFKEKRIRLSIVVYNAKGRENKREEPKCSNRFVALEEVITKVRKSKHETVLSPYILSKMKNIKNKNIEKVLEVAKDTCQDLSKQYGVANSLVIESTLENV